MDITMKTETHEDSEGNAKISDSAYSNSSSNSQSRRSRSSKSTNSGSRSSGSSGYGGKPSTSADSSDKAEPSVKRTKEKDLKKKKFKHPSKALVTAKKEKGTFSKPNNKTIQEENANTISRITSESKITSSNTDAPAPVVANEISTADENNFEASPVQNSLWSFCGNSVYSGKEPSKGYNIREGFSCVISMTNGIVIYTTASITTSLGFPKEVWIGRQFIDFVHPKDKETFSSQITPSSELPLAITDAKKTCFSSTKRLLFCRLRRYCNVSGNVKERAYFYTTFQLQLSYRGITQVSSKGLLLVIHASPVLSAYTVPSEVQARPTQFMTRHLAEGSIEYVDSESIPYLGYLPQDIIGKCAIDMYHPEDLTFLTQVYENIVKEGNYFNKKPYRFLIQNGDYVKLETNWSSFINPWSRKLEFVIGHHKIVEGPLNPDVFQTDSAQSKFCCEIKQKAKLLRVNILRILSEVPSKQDGCSAIKKFQGSHFDTVIDEMVKHDEEMKLDLQYHLDQNYLEGDSVMLGSISPSTGTPPSYDPLNYNENIQRYFDSEIPIKPADFEIQPDADEFEPPLVVDNAENKNVRSPPFESADSDDNFCCRTTPKNGKKVDGAAQNFKLTEDLLSKHNYEMEKVMMKRHREALSVIKANETERYSEKRAKKQHIARCNAEYHRTEIQTTEFTQQYSITQPTRGVKRCGSKSWNHGECFKSSKHTHTPSFQQTNVEHFCMSPKINQNMWGANLTTFGMQGYVSTTPMNMNPPQPHGQIVAPMSLPTGAPYPGLFPIFYVAAPAPAQQPPEQMKITQQTTNGDGHHISPMTPMPLLLYPPGMYGQPLVYASMAYQHLQQNAPTNENGNTTLGSNFPPFDGAQKHSKMNTQTNSSSNPSPSESLTELKNPSDRAAVRTKKNGNHSKDKGNSKRSNNKQSSQELSSNPSGASSYNMKGSLNTMEELDAGSTYSSFYSSFLNTDSGSAGSGDGDSGDGNAKKTADTKTPPSPPLENRQPSTNETKPEASKRQIVPPCNEQVCVTSELIYKHQILSKNLDDVLKADLGVLNSLSQPQFVNEQLSQLYLDLQLEGMSAKIILEEGVTSSGSSGEETSSDSSKAKRRKHQYSNSVMIFEEDAPFPPSSE